MSKLSPTPLTGPECRPLDCDRLGLKRLNPGSFWLTLINRARKDVAVATGWGLEEVSWYSCIKSKSLQTTQYRHQVIMYSLAYNVGIGRRRGPRARAGVGGHVVDRAPPSDRLVARPRSPRFVYLYYASERV